MASVNINNVGNQWCEIFGLNPDKTANIVLELKPDAIITLKATLYPDAEDLNKMIEVLKRFELREVED